MKNLFFWLVAILIAINSWGQIQLNEGFEGTTFPPDEWTAVHVSGSVSWERYTSSSPMGSACASVNFHTSWHENWLITPKLSVESEDDSISFYVKTSALYANTTLNVRISTTDTGISSFNATPLLTLISASSSSGTSDITLNWVRHAIDLSSYIGEEIYIAFQVVDHNGQRVMLDDVQGPNVVLPSCPKPTNLTKNNPTETSIDLSWIDPLDNVSSWNIEYILASEISWDNAQSETVYENPYTLNYLENNSEYKVRIQANCGGEESEWSDEITFQTTTIPVSIPFYCNFEDADENLLWGTLSNPTSVGWATGTAAGNGPTTEDPTDVTSMYVSTDGGTTFSYTDYNTLYTYRDIDFGETEGAYILFYDWKCKGEGTTTIYDAMRVFVVDPSTTLTSISNDDALATHNQSENWQRSSIELPAISGVKRLVFLFSSDVSGIYTPSAIDNISIDILTCSSPYDVAVTNITSTTADISFMSDATSWNIQYMLNSETDWDNAEMDIITSSPYTLNDLSPSSIYRIRIQADCGGEESEWTTATFKTECGSISALPYFNNFDSETTGTGNIPMCWTRPSNSSSTTYPYVYNSSSSAHSGTNSLYFYPSSTSSSFTVVTPPIAEDINSLRVMFWAKTGTANNRIAIGVISDLEDLSTLEMVDTITLATTYAEYEILFNETELTGIDNYIYLKAVPSSTSFSIYVDDLTIDYLPPCLRPTELSANNPTETSIDLSWNNESASYWNIQYMPIYETSWENAEMVTATNNPYTLDNLLPSSQYKIRIQAFCGEESDWTNEITFGTLCAPIETLPYFNNFDYEVSGSGIVPYCWTKPSTSTTNYPYVYNSSSSANSGTNSLYFYSASISNDISIITPPILEDINSLRIKFWARSSVANNRIAIGVMSDLENISTLEMVDTIPLTTTHREYEVLLNETELSGIGNYIYLKGFPAIGATTASIYLDDFTIDYLPSCFRPTELSANNITQTSFNVSFESDATSWNIQYMLETENNWNNATLITTTNNFYSIIGLTENTSYKVRVQANCGGEESDWTNEIIVKTPCNPIVTLPYFNNFDSENSGSGKIPNCWVRPSNSSTTTYPYVYNYSSNANSGSNSLYFYSSSATNDITVITQPFAEDINSLQITLWAKSSSANNRIAIGVMSDVGDLSTLEMVDTITLTTTYTKYEVFFNETELTGGNNYIVLKTFPGGNNTTAYVYVDDLTVDLLPYCLKPTNLLVNNTTTSSADISFTSDASSWNIQYMLASETSWENATTVAITTNPYTLTQLTENTTYKVRVQADCGDEQSEWSNEKLLQIPCYSIAIPWTENFDASTSLPNCFSTIKGTPTINTTNHSSPNSLRLAYGGWVTIPPFTEDISSLGIRFWARSESATYSGTLEVGIMSDINDTTTFESIYTIEPSPSATWVEYEIMFNNSILTGTDHFIAFKENNNANWFWWIDNIVVDFLPSCIRPTDLTFDNVTTTSVDISFTSNASSWNIQYMLASETDWDSATTEIATTNPYILNNLESGTEYKVRIQTDCGDEQSDWTNEITFTTPCVNLSVPTNIETFEAVPPSSCWTKAGGALPQSGTATLSGNGYWNSSTVEMYPGAGKNARLEIYSTWNGWLISPSIDLGTDGSLYQVELDALLVAYSGGGSPNLGGIDDIFGIVVSTDNGLTWNRENAILWTNEAGATRVLNDLYPMKHLTIPLKDANDDPYQGIVKIALYAGSTTSNVDNYIYVDNFVVNPYNPCSISHLTVSDITLTEATVSFMANEETQAWQYVITDNPTVTNPETLSPITITTNTINLTGLSSQTLYTIWVRPDCENGTYGSWISLSFVTKALPTSVPYYYNFEDANENLAWIRINLPYAGWATGSAAGNGPTTEVATDSIAMYISPDEGATYGYNGSYGIYSYTYRDIYFGETEESYILSYDWKCEGNLSGNSIYDGLLVFLLDTSTQLTTTFPSFANDSSVALNYNSPSWQRESVSLDGVSGIKRLAFYHWSGSTQYLPQPAIDNISITVATCPRPTNVVASNITSSSADLSWISNASSWNIEYMLASETDWTNAIPEVATSSSYTLNNLLSYSTYKVRIKTNCGNEQSEWSNTITFTTDCGSIETLPYLMNFDNEVAGSGNIPNCWTKFSSNNYPYVYNYTSYAHSGSNLLYHYLSSSTTEQAIATPPFSEDINLLRVKFWAYSPSGASGQVAIGVMSDITDNSTIEMIDTLTLTSYYVEYEVLFNETQLTGTDNHIFIKALTSSSSSIYVYVDDIEVSIIPSCAKPTNLTASNPTTTSIDLSWTDQEATSWNIQYMLASETSWTNATSEVVTSNPYTISNLSSSSLYKVRIQSNCGDEQSDWTNSIIFSTPCSDEAISSFPWEEGFEENGINCWGQELVAAEVLWGINLSSSSSTYSAHSGSSFAGLYINDKFDHKTKLISPVLDITGITAPMLEFYHMQKKWSSDQDQLRVFYRISQTDDWIQLLEYTNDIASWRKDSVILPDPSSTYQIAFEGNAKYGYGVAIDDIRIYDAEGLVCLSPNGLQISASNTTATLSWNAGDNETSWEVRLGTTGTVSEVTTLSHNFTGLTPNTSYTAQVRANCGSSYSAWQSINFTTLNAENNVSTLPATLITQFSATLNGEYSGFASNPENKGFEYKISDSESWEIVSSQGGTTPFYASITNLTPNSSYVYRAFVIASDNSTIYGNEVSFTTPEIVIPIVTTLEVTNISATSATFNATVEQGTEEVFARGFELKTSNQSWEDAFQLSGQGTSPFTLTYNTLTENENYDVRAYVKTGENGQTITYGAVKSFTASDEQPSITLAEVTASSNVLEDNTVILSAEITSFGGDNPENVSVGFKYSTDNSFTNDVMEVASQLVGNTFTSTLTDLSSNTLYYYYAFVNNQAGEANSQIEEFRTYNSLSDNIKSDNVNIVMYPNPAEKETKVIIDNIQGLVNIKLTDAQGRLINKTTINANNKVEHIIDVSSLSRGVYYIQIKGDNINRTQKLIVI